MIWLDLSRSLETVPSDLERKAFERRLRALHEAVTALRAVKGEITKRSRDARDDSAT